MSFKGARSIIDICEGKILRRMTTYYGEISINTRCNKLHVLIVADYTVFDNKTFIVRAISLFFMSLHGYHSTFIRGAQMCCRSFLDHEFDLNHMHILKIIDG